MKKSRRHFIKQTALAGAGIVASNIGWTAQSYNRIIGANDRVRVGVVGFSDRHRSSHIPCFMNHYKELNFDVVPYPISGKKAGKKALLSGKKKWGMILLPAGIMKNCMIKNCDAVFISTADFQHALHAIEAVKAGCDAYVKNLLQKPWKITALH